MNSYGEMIKDYRFKNNLTQKELGDILGVAASTVAMYESEDRMPRDNIKWVLSKKIGLSIEDLFFKKK